MGIPHTSRTLLLRLPIGRWQDRAECTTADAWLFHNTADEGHEDPGFRRDRVKAAKGICAACPVRRQCLEAALVEGDRWGIRGGTTPQERGIDSHGRKTATRREPAA